MTKSVLYRGGLPYAPDVARLNEAFPVSELKEGRVITHEEIEAALGFGRESVRYRGLLCSWMNGNRNYNGIELAVERKVGVKVLDPAGLMMDSQKTVNGGLRKLGRGIKKFSRVERARLDQTGQSRYDHQHRVLSTLKATAETAKKDLAIDLAPIQSLPKRRIA